MSVFSYQSEKSGQKTNGSPLTTFFSNLYISEIKSMLEFNLNEAEEINSCFLETFNIVHLRLIMMVMLILKKLRGISSIPNLE